MDRRAYLCLDSDSIGSDKNDAWTSDGAAGAGASVPLLGFGNLLFKGVKEAIGKEGFIGIFMGGFTASAVGISAALIFGYLASLIFDPKMKK